MKNMRSRLTWLWVVLLIVLVCWPSGVALAQWQQVNEDGFGLGANSTWFGFYFDRSSVIWFI